MMLWKIFTIFIALCNTLGPTTSETQKDDENWMEPNAWSKDNWMNSESQNDLCSCNLGAESSDVIADNQAGVFLFRKFIRVLFNRDKLEYDKQFELYQRELLFTVLPAQLEQLEQLTDPRDLDSVLTEIFGNARTPNEFNRKSGNSTWTSIFELVWDILKDVLMLLRFSEVQFITFALIFIMTAWLVHKKYKVGVIIVIIGGFFLFGYIITYLECNRELEIKQMLDVLEKTETTKMRDPGWYNFFGWFNENKVIERHEQLKKAKINLSFCRPDHVLMIYLNDLFYKQLEFFIGKCMTTLTTVQDTFTWPYNWIAFAGFIFLIIYILKLTFKHILSPRVWVGYVNRPRSSSISSQNERQKSESVMYHNEDRLSGENLRALLSALRTPSVFTNSSSIESPMGSCVQELEAIKQTSDSSHNNSSNNNSSSSLNSSTKSINVEADNSLKKPILSNSSQSSIKDEINEVFEESDKIDGDFDIISPVESEVTIEDLEVD